MMNPKATLLPSDTRGSAHVDQHHGAPPKDRPAVHLHPADNARWDPEHYEGFVGSLPYYDELQGVVCRATEDAIVHRVLELGIGTGETSRRLLDAHPEATLVGVDLNESMLGVARDRLPGDRVHLVVGRIEEPWPDGRYDLVVSVLTVHHLNAADKMALFFRVYECLEPGGRFVIGDIVVDRSSSNANDRRLSRRLWRAPRVLWEDFRHSDRDLSALSRIVGAHLRNEADHSEGGDQPETVADQLRWLDAAGFAARSTWRSQGCAVLVARKLP